MTMQRGLATNNCNQTNQFKDGFEWFDRHKHESFNKMDAVDYGNYSIPLLPFRRFFHCTPVHIYSTVKLNKHARMLFGAALDYNPYGLWWQSMVQWQHIYIYTWRLSTKRYDSSSTMFILSYLIALGALYAYNPHALYRVIHATLELECWPIHFHCICN